MGQKKLIRFEAIKGYENVFEYPVNAKGTWNDFFKNNNPITLELACGKGDYTIGLARLNPEINYIGIDIKSNRMWTGAKTAIVESISNVRFLRIPIDSIIDYFGPNEVSEIWITFADPQPQKERKRLSSFKFLNLYRQVAPPNALVNVKTDSELFFESTLEQIKRDNLKLSICYDDVYSLVPVPMILQIQTYYERMWLGMGRTIKYCQFTLGDCISAEPEKKCM